MFYFTLFYIGGAVNFKNENNAYSNGVSKTDVSAIFQNNVP